MSKNIWRDFAKLNDMSPQAFSDAIISATMAAMSMSLDNSESKSISVTSGKYTLTLTDNDKD